MLRSLTLATAALGGAAAALFLLMRVRHDGALERLKLGAELADKNPRALAEVVGSSVAGGTLAVWAVRKVWK